MNIPTYINDTGTGTPVILVHAFPLNADMWVHQHAGLPARVLSFDLPGFARGAAPQGDATIPGFAGQLFAIMDKLSIDKAVLGGCSMGGYVVMEALRQKPDRIKGLILTNTRAGADSPEAKENRYKQAEQVAASGTDDIVSAMKQKLMGPNTSKNNPEAVSAVDSMLRAASPEGVITSLKAMAQRADSTALLQNTDVPGCIITGKDDNLIPVSESEMMHSAMRSSELHVVNDAGHLSPLEQPEVVNAIIAAFLERLS